MQSLPKVRSGLLRHSLDQQELVYDSRDDRVHLLDPTTACVLELLEAGTWSAAEITPELGRRLGVQPSESLLFLAIDELRKADLLELGASSEPQLIPDMSRRDLVRKLTLAGAAAFLIPAVVTLTATSAYAASILALGSPCPSGGNTCAPGGHCNANGFCVSNSCSNVNGPCTTAPTCCNYNGNNGICPGNGSCNA